MAATSTTSATSRLVSAFSTTAAAAVSKSSPLLGRIASVPKEYPLAFGIVFSGLKTSFSDLLVQKVVEQREQVDWKRNAAFATFGFIYLGGVQYALYVPIFGRMFPTAAAFAAKTWRQKLHDARGMRNLCAQVFLDQCVHHPLLYFPAFYCTKELVMHENPDLRRVLGEYRQNMREDLKALWQIWVPATFFNFAFMPMWGRIPCVATTSLVWTCVLSAMRGGDLAHSEDMAGGAVTRATLNILEETIHGSRLFTQPIELQADKAHVVITAAGQDKTGWVAQLSRAVANAGGNISHSKMVRLGTDFIVTMHTSVPFSDEQKLVASLKNNADLRPLHIQCSKLARRKTGMYELAVMGVHLRCVGKDKYV
jgi:predicted amino acid-binding ACT domain protein